MSELETALVWYAVNPESPELNFAVGRLYHQQNQYAGAVSFYLRCAERAPDKELQYIALLKLAECFEAQGDHVHTVMSLYRHAICLLPERPEAYYFLSKVHKDRKEYTESYVMVTLGLRCPKEQKQLICDTLYPGEYGLLFQKSIAAWWWGKASETRELHRQLVETYGLAMDEQTRISLGEDMLLVGAAPNHTRQCIYDAKMLPRVKYKFAGIENVERSYSQVLQDMFVLSVLNGKLGGRYVEFGSAEPFYGNNTALLETKFAWQGVGVEHKKQLVDQYKQQRHNRVICADARQVQYSALLKEVALDGCIDYLQLDCDPAQVTFEILLGIPFEHYKFAVITYEHDHYADVSRSYQRKSRKYLESMGYELVVPDVSSDGVSSFEDWWVLPELVNADVVRQFKSVKAPQSIEDYFYLSI